MKQQKPTDYRVPGSLRKPKTALGEAAIANATAKRLASTKTPDELERIRMERARKRQEALNEQLRRAPLESRVLRTWFLQAPGWECDVQRPRACEPYGTGSHYPARPEKATSGLEQVGIPRNGIGTGNIKDLSV